jgi:hypothetical protein
MTDRRDIDPEQAAQITERIGQTFNFVRDAIANPRMLEEIPSGSMLRFRDVFSEGQRIRLTAFLPKQPGAQWDARVTGTVLETIPERSAEAERQPPLIHLERYPSVVGYETAEAALDALAAKISADSQSGPVDRRAIGA